MRRCSPLLRRPAITVASWSLKLPAVATVFGRGKSTFRAWGLIGVPFNNVSLTNRGATLNCCT